MLRQYPTLIKAIPFIFVAIGVFFIWAGQMNQTRRVDRNYATGKEVEYYTRIVACLASESPAKRTPEYTKHCYDEVEKQTGVKGDRYGTAK